MEEQSKLNSDHSTSLIIVILIWLYRLWDSFATLFNFQSFLSVKLKLQAALRL